MEEFLFGKKTLLASQPQWEDMEEAVQVLYCHVAAVCSDRWRSSPLTLLRQQWRWSAPRCPLGMMKTTTRSWWIWTRLQG